MRAAADITGELPPAVAHAVPSFAELYRNYSAFLWRALRSLGVREADVEDVCQEVFLVVHRKLGEFTQRSSLRTWLYSIAIRCAADYRRRAHLKREAPTSDAIEAPVDASQPTSVAERQALVVLDAILDTLDEAKRAVFVLYEIEELSMADVAEAVGCPVQTAYSRLHAARDAFQAAVKRHHAKERSS
jgi:RNA polymerase sigma-70 factor (ECF subfamily)